MALTATPPKETPSTGGIIIPGAPPTSSIKLDVESLLFSLDQSTEFQGLVRESWNNGQAGLADADITGNEQVLKELDALYRSRNLQNGGYLRYTDLSDKAIRFLEKRMGLTSGAITDQASFEREINRYQLRYSLLNQQQRRHNNPLGSSYGTDRVADGKIGDDTMAAIFKTKPSTVLAAAANVGLRLQDTELDNLLDQSARKRFGMPEQGPMSRVPTYNDQGFRIEGGEFVFDLNNPPNIDKLVELLHKNPYYKDISTVLLKDAIQRMIRDMGASGRIPPPSKEYLRGVEEGMRIHATSGQYSSADFVDSSGYQIPPQVPVVSAGEGVPQVFSSPELMAFMDTIWQFEGRALFNQTYGYRSFQGYQDHPRMYVKAGRFNSDAAGSFQFLQGTWDRHARKTGVKDFSPLSQIQTAHELADSETQKDTGMSLLALLQNGRIAEAIHSNSNRWASLPKSSRSSAGYYSTQGGKHSTQKVVNYYQQRLRVRQAEAAQNNPATILVRNNPSTTMARGTQRIPSHVAVVGDSIADGVAIYNGIPVTSRFTQGSRPMVPRSGWYGNSIYEIALDKINDRQFTHVVLNGGNNDGPSVLQDDQEILRAYSRLIQAAAVKGKTLTIVAPTIAKSDAYARRMRKIRDWLVAQRSDRVKVVDPNDLNKGKVHLTVAGYKELYSRIAATLLPGGISHTSRGPQFRARGHGGHGSGIRSRSQRVATTRQSSRIVSQGYSSDFYPPVGYQGQEVIVTSNFQPRRRSPVTGRITSHYATDLRGKAGAPVLALGHGVVESKSSSSSMIIRYERGGHTYRFKYYHISKRLPGTRRRLQRGAKVYPGQRVASVGRKDGQSTGPHLHVQAWKDGKLINPLIAFNDFGIQFRQKNGRKYS